MALVITRDAEEFAQRTDAFLATGLERNVLATVLDGVLRRGGFGPERPLFAYRLDEREQISGAALRTPPWPLLATGFAERALADELIRRWAAEDPLVPGVSGEPETARAVSAAWTDETGGAAECEFVEAIHVLTQVIPPRPPAAGRLRTATLDDRDLLITWMREFVRETGLGSGEHASRSVDRSLASDHLLIWDDARPVGMVGFNTRVAGVVRIGPVYTPPEHRNRGYATTATAAASQQMLNDGAERCMLFTDLSNPVSNRIYASIGYVRCGDWEQHGFQAPVSRHQVAN